MRLSYACMYWWSNSSATKSTLAPCPSASSSNLQHPSTHERVYAFVFLGSRQRRSPGRHAGTSHVSQRHFSRRYGQCVRLSVLERRDVLEVSLERFLLCNKTKIHRIPSLLRASQADAREQARDQKVLLCVRRVLINAVGGMEELCGSLSVAPWFPCHAMCAHANTNAHVLTVQDGKRRTKEESNEANMLQSQPISPPASGLRFKRLDEIQPFWSAVKSLPTHTFCGSILNNCQFGASHTRRR